ncbi:hypothetical protein ABMA28_001113, partial [Loxostege sticticalis]
RRNPGARPRCRRGVRARLAHATAGGPVAASPALPPGGACLPCPRYHWGGPWPPHPRFRWGGGGRTCLAYATAGLARACLVHATAGGARACLAHAPAGGAVPALPTLPLGGPVPALPTLPLGSGGGAWPPRPRCHRYGTFYCYFESSPQQLAIIALLTHSSKFHKNNEEIILLVCGKRAEDIENRRERILNELPNKNLREGLRKIPPSS